MTSSKRERPASERVSNSGVRVRKRKRLRIGIFGSGGNPWTISHKILAEQARVQYELDIVYLVTPGQAVDKQLADKEMRWELTQDAARGNEHFVASRVELDRKGPSYTVDTLKEFRRLHPGAQLFFIVGEDRAMDMVNWHRARTIVRLAKILVGPRYGGTPVLTNEWLQAVLPIGARFGAIEIGYSATWVRTRLALGKSVRYMVGENEINTIMRHGAYGTGETQQRTKSKRSK
jgi:nicotinate-nucleotide adenylyltransferase